MLRKLAILVLLLALLIFAAAIFKTKYSGKSQKKIHYHAGFQVYKNNKLVDFSDLKYMDDKPCMVNGKTIDSGNDQLEKAHLHDLVGDVVHIHRNSVYWRDVFINLKYSLNGEKVEGYIAGKKVDNILNYPIKTYDILILFVDSHKDISSYLPKAVTKQHILEVEQRSETCGNN